ASKTVRNGPVAMALPPAADVPAPWSPALVADRQQRILMQWGSGLARWDGRHWEQIAARQGLQTGGGVTALLQVRDGGVWLGTAGAGLAHWLGYEHLRHWGLAEGLPSDDVWSFLRSRAGELYIGTAGGLATEHGPLRGLQAPAPLRREVASSLAEDARGRLWVGSFNGALSRYDPITGTLTQLAKLPRITRLVTDRQGRLWIVTHDGIYLIDDPARDTPLHRIDQGLYPPKTQVPNAHDACLADDGRIWISTTTGLLRGEDGRLERLEVVDTTGQPLGEEWLRVIACGQGRLWMGGDHGLLELRIDGDSRTLRAQSLDVPLLHDRSVLSLHLDRRGWLWTGTDYGVAIWNMSRWRFIRQDAGLPWNDCNQGAVYEDRDGSMWLGTSRGAARFDDLDTLFAPPELSVHVGVQGRRLVRPDVRRGGADLTLPWQMRALVLDAASPAFEHRSALRFEYRMQGQDEDWRSGMAGELVYPSLQPGRYRFEVRVRNADLQAESPLQSLDIEVLPPWWRTDWFYALCATAAAALAWAAYRWRLHRVLARQRELRRLVAERTRQIEASHAQMRELALKDGLTGVLNRRALGDALAAEIARAGRSGKPLALVIVDADRFKQVNDRHGHLAGDAVLIAISQRLQAPTRPYDVVGRYGGEEFVLLLPDLDVDQPEGRARIDSFHRSISASAVKLDSGEELRVTCSFGVASLQPDRPESPNELIARADAALYRAKENGRNRVEYAPATPAP
ncbi:diguanylate cyclase, partial [Roseateles sp.]|uniref:ligand-binding sensor domain-containing diguanylate cyclase n=1 Tax=Roseateles sp. TaxID=1971397 RepID=UPI002E011B8D